MITIDIKYEVTHSLDNKCEQLKDNQLKSTALNGCITAKRKLLAAAVEIVERSRSQQQAAATSTEGAAASTETSPDTTDTHWEVDSVTSTDVPSQVAYL